MKTLTLVAVLRDGSHLIYQSCDLAPGYSGVKIGAHIAFRQKEHGSDLEKIVILHGGEVAEHIPT